MWGHQSFDLQCSPSSLRSWLSSTASPPRPSFPTTECNIMHLHRHWV
jgi:SET domain-containing protein